MSAVHHRYATIDGRQIFYREAGAADAPVIVLLHGFPASSFMFSSLIPELADRFHVIAPDYLGFGYSDAPAVEEFDYTFDALAELTAGLLDHLDVSRYSMFVQDYGAPVGWRLALRDPQAVTAIITQNGNGYDEGFVTEAWQLVWDYQREQTPQTTAAATDFLSFEATKYQYTAGAPDASVVSPDTWHHEFGLLSRPGNTEIQLKLFLDYASNPRMYPALHEYLRASAVPVLVIWGDKNPFLGADGALAFNKDAVDVEIHLLHGGHFLLESTLSDVVSPIRDFLARRLP